MFCCETSRMKQRRGGSPSHEQEMDKLDKPAKPSTKGRHRLSRLCFLVILTATFSTLLRHFHYSTVSAPVVIGPLSDTGLINPITGEKPSPSPSTSATSPALADANKKSDPCSGRYIYVQDIPSRFNADMVRDCGKLDEWTDMCKYTSNGGFGARLSNEGGVFSETGWYASDQYALDIIFHERVRRYECLTKDSSRAAAVFVPFYGGFDAHRHLWGYNVSTRDATALDLVDLLTARPEWRAMHGRDHFFVAGRTTWDFRRQGDAEAEWGNKLLTLPAAKNMTALVVEASPWHANDVAVPFPTSFHPAKDADVFAWQTRMRRLQRPWLFSFAGAPRPGNAKSVRTQLIDQCKESSECTLMQCGPAEPSKCYSPASVMKVFQSSVFCLQPQGDSYTRRSAFDAMLAGCIPVFFHPGTAYVQYIWHLPKNYTTYSVYISEDDVRRNVSIEARLRAIRPDVVAEMRETVVGLIPRLVYADPRAKLESIKDAFDVTVEAVIEKVARLRRGAEEGQEGEHANEMYSWKYPLLEEGQRAEDPHEWDSLFSFS